MKQGLLHFDIQRSEAIILYLNTWYKDYPPRTKKTEEYKIAPLPLVLMEAVRKGLYCQIDLNKENIPFMLADVCVHSREVMLTQYYLTDEHLHFSGYTLDTNTLLLGKRIENLVDEVRVEKWYSNAKFLREQVLGMYALPGNDDATNCLSEVIYKRYTMRHEEYTKLMASMSN